jgi:hypothetical protein
MPLPSLQTPAVLTGTISLEVKGGLEIIAEAGATASFASLGERLQDREAAPLQSKPGEKWRLVAAGLIASAP